MESKDINIQTVYEEVLKNRSEIRNFIEAVETRLLIKLEEANRRVTNLETENSLLRKQIEQLDRENRKNNLAIFGLNQHKDTQINETFICKELNSYLGVSVKESDIANVLPSSKKENCPLRVKLINYQIKNLIFKNCHKLKGTKVSISNDLTLEQQKEHKILRKHLTLAKLDGHRNSKIRGNKLIVDETIYCLDDLKKIEEADETKATRNSAPPTPSRPTINDSQRDNKRQEDKRINDSPKQNSAGKKKTPLANSSKSVTKYLTRSGSSSKK